MSGEREWAQPRGEAGWEMGQGKRTGRDPGPQHAPSLVTADATSRALLLRWLTALSTAAWCFRNSGRTTW